MVAGRDKPENQMSLWKLQGVGAALAATALACGLGGAAIGPAQARLG
jgi:hypothetical protein